MSHNINCPYGASLVTFDTSNKIGTPKCTCPSTPAPRTDGLPEILPGVGNEVENWTCRLCDRPGVIQGRLGFHHPSCGDNYYSEALVIRLDVEATGEPIGDRYSFHDEPLPEGTRVWSSGKGYGIVRPRSESRFKLSASEDFVLYDRGSSIPMSRANLRRAGA